MFYFKYVNYTIFIFGHEVRTYSATVNFHCQFFCKYLVIIALKITLGFKSSFFTTCSTLAQTPRINPPIRIRRIQIEIIPTTQPNRILRNKPPNLRIVIPKRVVVKPRLHIEILP